MTIIDALIERLAPTPPDGDDRFDDVAIEVGENEMVLPITYQGGLSGADDEIDTVARALIRRAFFAYYGGLERRVPGAQENGKDLAIEVYVRDDEIGDPLWIVLDDFARFFEARGISLRVVQIPDHGLGSGTPIRRGGRSWTRFLPESLRPSRRRAGRS